MENKQQRLLGPAPDKVAVVVVVTVAAAAARLSLTKRMAAV